jgi:hypothetical protein
VALFDLLPETQRGSGPNALDFRLTPFQDKDGGGQVYGQYYYQYDSCLIKDKRCPLGSDTNNVIDIKICLLDGTDQAPSALLEQHRTWVQSNKSYYQPGFPQVVVLAPLIVYNADKVKWEVMEEDLGPWLRGELAGASIFLLAARSWPGLNLASPIFSVRDYRGFPKKQPEPENRPRKGLLVLWGSPRPEPAHVKEYSDMQRHMLSQAQAAWAAGACSLNNEARALPQMTGQTVNALGKLASSLTQAWQEAQSLHDNVQRHVQSLPPLAPPPKRPRRSDPQYWFGGPEQRDPE